ncbi:MAG: helix-turn-helix transcriptional regulator [Saprospiraceae bacterium]
MTLNEIVASKIKDQRVSLGLTCEAAADMLGISKGAYSNLENAKVEITISRLEIISRIFNQPMDHFIPSGQTVNQVSHGNGANVGRIDTQNNYTESNLTDRIKEAIERVNSLIAQVEKTEG